MIKSTCDQCGNESEKLRQVMDINTSRDIGGPYYIRVCPACYATRRLPSEAEGKLRGMVSDFEANQRDAGVLDDSPDEGDESFSDAYPPGDRRPACPVAQRREDHC